VNTGSARSLFEELDVKKYTGKKSSKISLTDEQKKRQNILDRKAEMLSHHAPHYFTIHQPIVKQPKLKLIVK
jgi:hypothetical protein